jgi:hypothetical protein
MKSVEKRNQMNNLNLMVFQRNFFNGMSSSLAF